MEVKTLTRSEIVDGLKTLGVQAGDKVLVHSSLAALGAVEGGTGTVIEALLEAVGPKGLVAMPTFATAQPFDRKTAATPLGAIADTFWRRPDALRSKHPTHSVAVVGAGAKELIRGHEKAPTAYAEGTPYFRLAKQGGKILLLGVDQDRNTTLHTAEALAGAAYLKEIAGTYVDDDGTQVTIPIAAMAGPHRDFIGLDGLFRATGVMKVGRIGSAACRLMDAGLMLDAALGALQHDPAAVLCDNPACADCVMQRGRIKAARLAAESFTLAAVAGDISQSPVEILPAIQGEGITALELTRDEYRRYGPDLTASGITIAAIRAPLGDQVSASLAGDLKVPLVQSAGTCDELRIAANMRRYGCEVLVENNGAPSSAYAEAFADAENALRLAFNPGRFTAAGEKPFLRVFYRGGVRKQTAHFYVDDATWNGAPALPGRGNGEVKEILSMLRCRSFDGVVTLRSHEKGVAAFHQAAAAFWRLLDGM